MLIILVNGENLSHDCYYVHNDCPILFHDAELVLILI